MKSLSNFIMALGCLGALITAGTLQAKALHLKSGQLQLNNPQLMTTMDDVSTDYYIVQFKNRINYSDREELEALGAIFKSYIPEDALLVEMTPAVRNTVADSLKKKLETVIPYMPEFKISSTIRPSIFNSHKEISLIVRVVSNDRVAAVLRDFDYMDNTRIEEVDGRMIYLSSRNSQVFNIAKTEGVEWIEEKPVFELAYMNFGNTDTKASSRKATAGDYSDLTGYESGVALMNFSAAYKRGLSGAGQIGAMADTGLDNGNVGNLHPDYQNVFKGYAEGLFSKTWEDPQGHGTHVAGSVMGSGRASGGRITGGAPGARLVAQGMWSKMMNNLMVPPKIGEMFGRSYSDGARVHTNSWGSPQNLGDYSAFSAQVDEFMWNNPEMLVIFAAGNSGQDANLDGRIDEGSVSSPGTAKNVLTVGASENLEAKGGIQRKLSELRGGDKKWGAEPIASDTLSNNPRGIAAFSSRGPTRDGRMKPDVVAPGTNILSGRSSVQGASTLWGAYNEHYVWAGGTSMATPLTAGAALVLREYITRYHHKPAPSAALVKAGLIHTALDLFPGQYGTGPKQELQKKRPNVHEGYGKVDLGRHSILDYSHMDDNKLGLKEGEVKKVTMTIERSSRFIATLAYTDAPAAASAAKALVNDLDLFLVNQKTKQIFSLRDSVNNVEMVEGKLEPGKYDVVVKASRLINGKNGRQPYALIVSAF